MKEDLIKDLEYMGLATWLKRLSDTMIHSGRKMYKSLEMDIEPNWYLIFKLLKNHDTLSVTEMAEKLRFSHPSVISIIEKMKANGYLESFENPNDKRKQQFKLSEKANENLVKFEELWECGIKAMQEIFNNNNLLKELEKLENALTVKSFKDRTLEHYLPSKEIRIVPFSEKFAIDFAVLNYEWLSQYFEIEEHDRELLDHPIENIIEKGGKILIALNANNKAVGTVALIKYDHEIYELAKMAVTPAYKGYKIGDRLLVNALEVAKELQAKKVFLETNTLLTPAVNLYKKHGFVEIPANSFSPYKRSNLKMEIHLKSQI